MFHSSHDLMPLLAQNNTLSSDTFPYIQYTFLTITVLLDKFSAKDFLKEITDEQQL